MRKNYAVEVQTGNATDAGTDADVFIQLFGEKATSIELNLDNAEDNFEKGKLDHFTVSAEDVGWIDRIRVFHNNNHSAPGWFVNYIKVTDQAVGLSWRIDLNRWLAKDEADKSIDLTVDVPIGGVSLDPGYMRTYYLGFLPWNYPNNGPRETMAHASFSYTYKLGVSTNLTTSISETTNMQLGGTFFGIDARFSESVTTSVAKTLGTTTEETCTMVITLDYPVPAGKMISVAFLVYQTVLDGTARGSGVKFDYENKFIISYDPYIFDGLLTEAQLNTRVQQMLSASMGVALPSPLPKTNAHLLLMEKKLAITDATHIQAVQKGMPAHLIQDAQLKKYTDVHFVAPGLKPVITKVTPVVSTTHR